MNDNHPIDNDDAASGPVRDPHNHHAGLWSTLVQRADAVKATIDFDHENMQARSALVDFLRTDILAHLEVEEHVLYQAAREIGATSLVAALELDHRRLLDLVEQIEKTGDGLEAAMLSRALVVLFALRMEKEDTIVLPTLTDAGVDVSSLLDRMIVQMATDYDSRFTYF
ncbi:MAG TPA: hemerythrin domain-containing protein [Arthrobacter sp.]|jgi:iron-sulfur cluster repair protein YtfE (RIC family)|nr:hemerythrin domain-containing protein [Arthrobacter sp.]